MTQKPSEQQIEVAEAIHNSFMQVAKDYEKLGMDQREFICCALSTLITITAALLTDITPENNYIDITNIVRKRILDTMMNLTNLTSPNP